MKALPLTYNRDMQEDKEPLFDCIDTFTQCSKVMAEIIKGAKFNKHVIKSSLKGNMLATDIADSLTYYGVPFRQAHIIVSNLTKTLNLKGKVISDLSLNELNSLLDSDIDVDLDVNKSINKRSKIGGTSEKMVKE
jgi:argininosuccinate lyase